MLTRRHPPGPSPECPRRPADPARPAATGAAPPFVADRPLDRLARPWAVLLTTRRRNGTWVGTPVNVAVDGDRAYFGTPASTAKVPRLRNSPDVRVAPCTPRGTPTGPGLPARARLLGGGEAAAAARLLRRAHPVVHGVLVPLELRIRRTRGLYYELRAWTGVPDAAP
ncbi:PPOX class F420-dependent oxidoreductase [Geodermatophilus sp. CPCC 206100]|uniref:PPOX class F420-dependent oxidoreductase n=1 Tax=Geodermatophilus sp. CPCC 206100 TaxID=3020054 RepID=UPI003AFFDE83